MSLTVRGSLVHTTEELIEKCMSGEAHQYALQLQSVRYSYDQIPDREKKIGTLDATSCLGIVYRTEERETYVQHHDGRPLKSLLNFMDRNLFKKERPIQVTLIGGCKRGRHSLEIHTRENIEKLFKFWQEHAFNIDIQGWVIGDARSYETLCCDFVADDKAIYLIKQGEVGTLNFKMKGALIPELSRRLATTLSDESYFFINPHSQKSLQLAPAKNIHHLKQLAQQLIKLDDATLLRTSSTTPEIEPPYYPQMIRGMASYILSEPKAEAIEVPLLKEHSIFAIQGEVVFHVGQA